jgi:hypothetical protein
MTNSITPPRELVEQWASEKSYDERDWLYELHIAARAAQWGADQELEACCEWTQGYAECGDSLRAARRPKPPSLKEQALTALHAVATGANDTREQHQDLDTIRKALEALPND